MVDFTQIEIKPISNGIVKMQNANAALSIRNDTLKKALILSGAVAVGLIVYMAIKKQQEMDKEKLDQLH